MAQLIVRNLDEELVRRLKRRAAEHGRSVEAEHRLILHSVLMNDAPPGFKDWLMSLSELDSDLDITRNRQDTGRDVERLFD